SLFGPGLTSQTVDSAAQTEQQAQAADAGIPSAAPVQAGTAAVPGEQAPATAQSEQVEVSTDVLRLTFDTQGAQLIRAELPRFTISSDSDQPFTLLDRRAGYTYVAQSGVVGAAAGQNFPTHL